MEEEDFEIVQPSQITNRQFDFFHPNPFTDGERTALTATLCLDCTLHDQPVCFSFSGDVFGDDHFPKADVTGLFKTFPCYFY